jgi:hypothetical protein
LSGDQNAYPAPAVPSSRRAAAEDSDRTHSFVVPSVSAALNASWVPSFDSAN